MTEMISATGLCKAYRGRTVLDGVDLRVPAGSVCALLGPNGAGKTTVVKILTTLVRPDAGHAAVGGIDVVRRPDEARAIFGVVGQYPAVDEVLDARQNLVLFARLHHLSRRAAQRRADELLEQVGLTDTGRRPVRQFSGGMRRRLDLAAGLVLQPRVLFLDEPTTGLDPASRRDIWDAVHALVQTGTAVLMTTQYLEEAAQLADAVCIVDRGRVVARGTPAQLTAAIGSDRLELVIPDAARAPEAASLAEAAAQAVAGRSRRDGIRLTVPVTRHPGIVSEVVRALDGAGIAVDDVVLRPTTLDEAYLRITGAEPAREELPA